MNNLTYPRFGTNSSRYLSRFLLGEKLKHRDADKVAGSYRLSGYTHYLKSKHGWPIASRELTDDTLDPIGRTALFTEYWLDRSTIQRAGDDGQEYAERVLGWETERIASRVAATTPNAEIDETFQSTINSEPTTQDAECRQMDNKQWAVLNPEPRGVMPLKVLPEYPGM